VVQYILKKAFRTGSLAFVIDALLVFFGDCNTALLKNLQCSSLSWRRIVTRGLRCDTNCHTVSNEVFAGVAGNMYPCV